MRQAPHKTCGPNAWFRRNAKRLADLEVENARLKKLLAEAELDKAMLTELASESNVIAHEVLEIDTNSPAGGVVGQIEHGCQLNGNSPEFA